MTSPTHRTNKYLLVLAITALLLAGCAQAMSPQRAPETAGDINRPGAGSAPIAEGGDSGFSQSTQDVERLVIKNADLTIVVADPEASMDHITSMAEEMGGFVVTANLYQQQLAGGGEAPEANITVRVPAERLTEALQRIRSESDQPPLSESLNSQDVTKDYTDLQSRLRNLEDTEEQLRSIMDDATKTEDVLAVYNQLVQVREQIEVTKGQIQYYEQSAALSAITANLKADEAVKPLTIGGWQPGGVAKQAIQALISAFKSIINAAIWIVIFIIPALLLILVIFVLPVYLVIRAWRRRRRAKKSAVQTASEGNGDLPPG